MNVVTTRKMAESYNMTEINGNLDSPENGHLPTEKIKPEQKEVELKRVATFGELFSYATCTDRLLILLALVASIVHGASWPLLFLIFGNMTNQFVYFSQDLNAVNETNCNETVCGQNRSVIYVANNTTAASGQNLSVINVANNITSISGQNFSAWNTTGFAVDMAAFEDLMTQYALKYIYIGIGVFFVTYVYITSLRVSCERQTYKLKQAFFKALLRQNIEWYDKQQSGELTTRLADDLERIKDGMGDKIGLAIQSLSQFLAGFAIGFVRSWKLTLVMMSLTPLLALISGMLGKLITTYSAREQQLYASAGAVAEEALSCIRTVISFNGHSKEIEKYTAALEGNKKIGIKKSVFAGVSVGLLFLLMFGAYGLAFWFGSTQVNDYNNSNGEDGLSPGGVLSVFFCVMAGSFALGSASPHITSILTAKGAGGTIYSIIKDKPVVDSSDSSGLKPAVVQGHIQFRDIEFSYPTRKDIKILKKFNMDIQPGQTVALVGASGCGKSTIVNLIQRFYDPQNGQVLLDDIDVKDINIQWLRGNIGVVSQEPVLFGMSVAQNIALGRPGVSIEEIHAAAKMANAHTFITALPKGYDTLVGERGAQLSGGQKQRVAIARALVRDPKILLLDEATSALDSKSEGVVQEALDKAQEGRTTIVVAHRLATIQNADVIYVMDKGEVAEMGKHKDLMEMEGMYYNLVMLQTITEQEDNTENKETGGTAAATDDGSPSINKLVRQISRQISQAGVKRQVSEQSVNAQRPAKTPNLFRPKSVEEEEIEDNVPRPGFARMFKSNIKEWPFILFGCIGAVINGSTFPVFAVFFSEIIKTFGLKGQELLDKGLFWSMMFVAMGGLAFFCHIIQQSAFGYSGETLTARLRSNTFKNLIRQDVEYFDNPSHSTGALTTRLATDASMVKNATGIRLAMLVQSIISMIAGLVIAFYFGWKLALAVLGGVPIMLLAGTVNARLMKTNQQRDSKLLEDAGKTASECIENIRTVQALTREQYFYDQYCDQLEKPHRENLKQAHLYGLSYAFSQGVIFLLYAAAFRFGAWLVVHDGLHPDLVYRVFFAIAFTGMSLGQAASFMPDYSKAQLSAGHIFSLIDAVPKIDIYSSDGVIKSKISGDILLKNVHFSYPTRPEVEILKGIDLHVKPGQTAALVGMSGCGKSTIVSLVQRYYDTTEGSIVIEGMDVRQHNLKSLRSLMSVVSQEPILFDRSIRDNIVYGLEQDIPMADVIAAAKTANAHDFISKLPDGYDTMVGEKGTQLSGGQKQRVAIARALIRNPKILLLDEATSALDTESEKIVQTALDKAREGRTCIVIAHRFSTIQNADIIYTMENGKIIESGTHQELLAKKGAYCALVQGQKFRTDNDGH